MKPFKLQADRSRLTLKWFPRSFYNAGIQYLYLLETVLTVSCAVCIVLWINHFIPFIPLVLWSFCFWVMFAFVLFNYYFVRETIHIDQTGYHQNWGLWFFKQSEKFSLERLIRFEVEYEKEIKKKKIYSLIVRVLHDDNSKAYLYECARDENAEIENDFTHRIVSSESQDVLKTMMQELNDFLIKLKKNNYENRFYQTK
jgi:hypothetical protein